MKVLLVYPETPTTFWSFRNALKFVSKKSSEPPLGLLTVAAMLPPAWDLRLVDMNVTPLRDEDIRRADMIFLSGMTVHFDSMKEVIARAKAAGVKVVAGGPLCTSIPEEFEEVDHLILNEAEITLPPFLADLQAGTPRRVYRTDRFPDITSAPLPRWDLLEQKKYATMSLQYSRGCPYDCEFCNITTLNGRRPRVKTAEQFLAELETLYKQGWRGNVFVVDDNFIGNRRALKQELLPAMIRWAEERHHPFTYITEVSINLADDEELMELMVAAGFNSAFVGIETPAEESLTECGKTQNQHRDLLSAVNRMQRKGLIVSAGFIVGFDNDPPSIFERQINFIQNSGIVTAMVGLLNAPTGTRLFKRLKKEKRILQRISGDNMDGSINFIPRMNLDQLMTGYRRIVHTIYSPQEYYRRVKVFLQNYQPVVHGSLRLPLHDVLAFFKSLWVLGLREKGKWWYWRLVLYSLFRHPQKFPVAIRFAIYGFHFRRVAEQI